jgi:hypothetical protein
MPGSNHGLFSTAKFLQHVGGLRRPDLGLRLKLPLATNRIE